MVGREIFEDAVYMYMWVVVRLIDNCCVGYVLYGACANHVCVCVCVCVMVN